MPNKTYTIGNGIEARMFYPDHNPPHIHVFSGMGLAVVRIADGAVIRGRIRKRDAGRVRQWLNRNRAALLRQWKELEK